MPFSLLTERSEPLMGMGQSKTSIQLCKSEIVMVSRAKSSRQKSGRGHVLTYTYNTSLDGIFWDRFVPRGEKRD